MVKTDFLGDKLGRLSPNHGVRKIIDQCSVELLDCRPDSAPVSLLGEYEWVLEIGMLSLLFSVDPDESQLFPDSSEESVEVQLHLTGDDDVIGLTGYVVNFLHADGVDLVVDVDALDILSIPFDGIDDVIDSDVLPAHDISVVDFVLGKDILNHSLIDIRELLRRDQSDTSSHLVDGDGDIRLLLVESHSDFFQFSGKFSFLFFCLGGIKNHEN